RPNKLTKIVKRPNKLTKYVKRPNKLTKIVKRPNKLTKYVKRPNELTKIVNRPNEITKYVKRPNKYTKEVKPNTFEITLPNKEKKDRPIKVAYPKTKEIKRPKKYKNYVKRPNKYKKVVKPKTFEIKLPNKQRKDVKLKVTYAQTKEIKRPHKYAKDGKRPHKYSKEINPNIFDIHFKDPKLTNYIKVPSKYTKDAKRPNKYDVRIKRASRSNDDPEFEHRPRREKHSNVITGITKANQGELKQTFGTDKPKKIANTDMTKTESLIVGSRHEAIPAPTIPVDAPGQPKTYGTTVNTLPRVIEERDDDSGYGEWSPWTECSLTCGITSGTRQRTRTCDSEQGRCNGPNSELMLCNVLVCN
ncbi:unnamed protein product, partial [Owenia fusiformis]